MFVLEELTRTIAPYRALLVEMGDSLNHTDARVQIDKLESQTAEADFWADPSRSQVVLRELKILRGKIGAYDKLNTVYDDVLTLIEMATEENDTDLAKKHKQPPMTSSPLMTPCA